MDGNQNAGMKRNSQYRKKRVKRLKWTIIVFILVVLVFPMICCFYLLNKIDHLENRIEEIKVMKQQNEFSEDVVLAAELDSSVDPTLKTEQSEPIGQDSEDGEEALSENVTKSDEKLKNRERVYLTFDDGPSEITPDVLDILKKEEVKATFFVIGKEDKTSKQLYKRIVEEGHTLGMHSYTHQYAYIYKSIKNYKNDLFKLSDLLYDVTGIRPKFYRFPGGSSTTANRVSIKDCKSVLRKNGIKYFDWNVVNGDTKDMTDKQMVKSVISNVKNFKTSIVLMHDAVDKGSTVRTLSTIIKKLKKERFLILPIDETTEPIRHK